MAGSGARLPALLTGTRDSLGAPSTAILFPVFRVREAIPGECFPVFLWHFALGTRFIGHNNFLRLPAGILTLPVHGYKATVEVSEVPARVRRLS